MAARPGGISIPHGCARPLNSEIAAALRGVWVLRDSGRCTVDSMAAIVLFHMERVEWSFCRGWNPPSLGNLGHTSLPLMNIRGLGRSFSQEIGRDWTRKRERRAQACVRRREFAQERPLLFGPSCRTGNPSTMRQNNLRDRMAVKKAKKEALSENHTTRLCSREGRP